MSHDTVFAGHRGIQKTQERLAESGFWPGMLDACAKFVNSCPTCQEARETKVRGKTGILKMPNESVVNFRVHIDLFGPLKSSTAMKWILVATCAFSRYTRICAIKDKCEKTVATAFFNTWVCLMGCPALLVSDNGGEFINKEEIEICIGRGGSYCTDPGGKFKYKRSRKKDKRIGCRGVGNEKGRKRKKICDAGCVGDICRKVKQRCLKSCGEVGKGECGFLKEYDDRSPVQSPTPAPTRIQVEAKIIN